jgi:drug/metabolite transporter (DMT)-like permease
LQKHTLTFGYCAAILSAVLAGSVSTVAKPILSGVHPFLLAAITCFLISLMATPLTKNKTTMGKKDLTLILLISISGAILAPVFFYTGLKQTTASDTALLSNGEMMFTILLGVILFKERLKPVGYAAVGIISAGVIIVTTNLQFSDLFSSLKNIGNILVLASMAFWALDNNLTRIVIKKINIPRAVQLKCLIAGVFLILLVLALGIPITITTSQIPSILFLGIAGSGASLILFMYSLKAIGTVRTVLIVSTSSAFGLIFASIFLHENIGVYQILAIIMMLAGIFLVEKKGQMIESKN